MVDELLRLAVWVVLALYALWIFYLAIMNLSRADQAHQLRPVALALGIPVLVVGYTMDALINVLVLTVLMLELPRELTVSERLGRHLRSLSGGWRYRVSRWVCVELLDQFDPTGKHCR